MKAVDAEGHYGDFFRQGAHPLFYAFWVAPYPALGDFLTSRRVVTRTRVDQLYFVTALDHVLDVLWCDRRQITELCLLQGPRRGYYGRILIATLDGSPVYIAHERGHIRLRIGTELDMIGMFVQCREQGSECRLPRSVYDRWRLH